MKCKRGRAHVGVRTTCVSVPLSVRKRWPTFPLWILFLSCWPVLGARACLLVHSLGEKKGEEEGGGVECSHGRTMQLDECTERPGLVFLFFFQSFSDAEKCLMSAVLSAVRLLKGNRIWMSKGQPGNKNMRALQGIQSVFNLTLKLTS